MTNLAMMTPGARRKADDSPRPAPGTPARQDLARQYLRGAENLGHIPRGRADSILADLAPRRGTPLEHLRLAHAAAFGDGSGGGTVELQGNLGRQYCLDELPYAAALRAARRLGAGGFFDERYAADAAESFARRAPGATEAEAAAGLVRMLASSDDRLDVDPSPGVPLTPDEQILRDAVVRGFSVRAGVDLDDIARRVGRSVRDPAALGERQLQEELRLAIGRSEFVG